MDQNVARLAVQEPADPLERLEAYALDPRLEQREVGFGDADIVGEVLGLGLPERGITSARAGKRLGGKGFEGCKD